MAPLRKLFKNTLSLPISINNNVISTHLFPSINNLINNQLQSHLANVNYLLNAPDLQSITIQKLLDTQYFFWTPHFPDHISISKSKLPITQASYLTKCAILFAKYHISIHSNFDSNIKGGNTPITEYYPDFAPTDLKSLRTKRVIFADQVTKKDGIFLHEYHDIDAINHQGPIPNWYKKLVSECSYGPNLKLYTPLSSPVVSHLVRNSIPNDPSSFYYRPKRKIWVIYWDSQINNIHLGKIIEIKNHIHGIPTAFIEHWKYSPLEIDKVNTTPKQYVPIFTPCPNCRLHTYFHRDIRPKCVLEVQLHTLHRINIRDKNYRPYSSIQIPYAYYIISNNSFHTLRVTAFNLYSQLTSRDTPLPLSDNFPNSFSSNYVNTPQIPISTTSSSDPTISNMFIDCPITLTNLSYLKELNSQCTTFNFFTDGSVQSLTKQNCKIGFGWIETLAHNTTSYFAGYTTHLLSATKAETMAVLTALITVPPNSDKLKTNNFLLWFSIQNHISINNIKVSLVKIKAHSNNISNDLADHQAKLGCNLPDPIIINPRSTSFSIGILTWNNLGCIDKNLRKWSKVLTAAKTFNQFLQNNHISPVMQVGKIHSIDFHLTQQWLNFIPDNLKVSISLNKFHGSKIKAANFHLPTGSQQKLYYPHLYPMDTIVCPLCHLEEDSNTHFGNCSTYTNDLQLIIQKYKSILIDIVNS
ncbi:hypothetical protein C1645_828826 [Glomus cerebriforme]|uniref:RNase H type-1 domain-containing protein n=1 Tax=Glomus cerebriforme TaxID=658196 RepID=A0A397SV24_9GLOM|nr:hypothetical protein C1645_828826 [Glomus cerebriforme]